MRENKEPQETGKLFTLTIAMMNVLILTVVCGIFWLAQVIISQANQLSDPAHGFNLM